MADYYTQYSAEIDNLTDDEIKWLEVRLKGIEDARAAAAAAGDFDQDVDDLGQMELRDRTLWFSGEESGDPRAVADFVQGFLKQFRPNSSFSMGHTFSCSQPRLDGFGGGAVFVTAEKIEHLDSFSWLWALCEEHKNRGTEQN